MKSIHSIFDEIRAVKNELGERIIEINKLTRYTDEAKAELRGKAVDEAKERLGKIGADAENTISALEDKVKTQHRFDYSDQKLLSAVQFIQANGAALPEAAWRQMIADFDGKYQELFYLSEMFDKYGVLDAAITARDEAQRLGLSESFPRRLSDFIYFATQADPTANIDFSGYEAELARFEEGREGEEEQT